MKRFYDSTLIEAIIQGTVNIYFIRDDGSVYSLANGRENDLLGEMEIFQRYPSNVYAEANDDVICIALSIETKRCYWKIANFCRWYVNLWLGKWNPLQRLTLLL